MATGIYKIHSRGCHSRPPHFGDCNCKGSWQAFAGRVAGKPIRKNFKTHAEAKAWREDMAGAVRYKTIVRPVKQTLSQVAEEFLAGIKDGSIRNRSGAPYKPSAIRSYERALRVRVLPKLGHVRLSELDRGHVQDFADSLVAQGHSASLVNNTLDPLRAIYRRAMRRRQVAVNPTTDLEVPKARGRRKRVASKEEAAALVAAAPEQDRALWATAFYAGLRRGELRELRWSDVDLDAGTIQVERALDDGGDVIETKTENADRKVFVAPSLKKMLAAHKLRTGRKDNDLVFGRTAQAPFIPSTVRRRALKAWKDADLEPITPHEGRHTWVSMAIAAGVNPNTIKVAAGHGSYAMTMDHYGKLLPGAQEEAAKQFDAYLDQAAGE